MERLFQTWELERKLLVQRLYIFLLINSIVLISFVNLLTKELWLGFVVAGIGFITSMVAIPHFIRIGNRLNEIEMELKECDEELDLPHGKLEKLGLIGGKRRARWTVAVLLSSLFLILWIAGVIGLTCIFSNA